MLLEIEKLLAPLLAEQNEDYLIKIIIKPVNNIKIYLDNDHGVSISKCSQYNRKLYQLIEEKALYPDGVFSLEVSSAGLDQPLLLDRQYIKNIGRTVQVTFHTGAVVEGELLSKEEKYITIRSVAKTKPKQKIADPIQILLEEIKSTTILPIF